MCNFKMWVVIVFLGMKNSDMIWTAWVTLGGHWAWKRLISPHFHTLSQTLVILHFIVSQSRNFTLSLVYKNLFILSVVFSVSVIFLVVLTVNLGLERLLRALLPVNVFSLHRHTQVWHDYCRILGCFLHEYKWYWKFLINNK